MKFPIHTVLETLEGMFRPTAEQIAAATGLDKRVVTKALHNLKFRGLAEPVASVPRRPGQKGRGAQPCTWEATKERPPVQVEDLTRTAISNQHPLAAVWAQPMREYA